MAGGGGGGPGPVEGGGYEYDPTRGQEGRTDDLDSGAKSIVRDQGTPGIEFNVGGRANDIPNDVKAAASEYDSLYEPAAPKNDVSSVGISTSLADPFGDPIAELRHILGLDAAPEPTRVNNLEARRASAMDPILAPMDFVQLPDGEQVVVQRGNADFVDIETVKRWIGEIENKTSWSEGPVQAMRRKAAQFERDGKLTKEDAMSKAVAWYKGAQAERRQAFDARVAELLPTWRQKFPKNPDMARHHAERQAKAEWDKGIEEAKADLPVVVDTSIPGMGFGYVRTVDHHGAFLKKADGSVQKANATMQMMNRFEDALRAAGTRDVNRPTDVQVREAMRLMNVKQVTTDNLADGGWSVWMSKHQSEVLKDPALRSLIRRATYFEDFTAFSQGKYDRNDPAVELQVSLFYEYGKILDKYGVKGSDRIPPDKADAIMAETMTAMDKMVYDPIARTAAADVFWSNVDSLRAKADQAVIYEAKGTDGRTLMKFYDMTKLTGTVFEQWLAVPDAYRQRPQLNADGSLKLDDQGHPIMGPGDSLDVQVTVAPMPDGRTLPIVAVPYGNKVGNRSGLLSVLDALNKAEKAKADSLGVPANFWFGKDSVVLPNPAGGGSRLSMKEIADIVTDPKYGLFDKKGGMTPGPQDGQGARLSTVDGKTINPLNPRNITEVSGFDAQRSYRDASRLIDEYGVGRDGHPRSKGERLAELANLGLDQNGVGGDPRAREALDLLYQMKLQGENLIYASGQGADQKTIDDLAGALGAKTARFKTLVSELGLDGASTVPLDKRQALKDRASAADAEYNNHQKYDLYAGADGTQVEYLRDAEAWAAQGNEAQKAAARDVLSAAASNKTVLQDIAALEKALAEPNGFGDPSERTRAEKSLGDLYGVLDRNMKLVDRWKNYMPERKDFDLQVAKFEAPYIGLALMGGMRFLGFETPSPLGVVDVTTRSPEYYDDLQSGIGKPGDYAVTIWVRTPADQQRILGDVWKGQNPNNVKWGRDGQGRYLRVIDAKGREMDVHVALASDYQSVKIEKHF